MKRAPILEKQRARMAVEAIRVPLRPLLLLATVAALFFALAPAASADLTFCPPGSGAGQCQQPEGVATDFETGRVYIADQGNNRIDVFESDGSFVMAFGWGVANGANSLQGCGPQATPPTVSCFKGIAGSGAGQFSDPPWIAVDNDPASPSRHDLYVGTDNFRIQKFGPEGNLLLSFGSEGKGECEFMHLFEKVSNPIAVGPGGDVYVVDSYDKDGEGPLRIYVNRVERFDSSGNCLGEVVLFEEDDVAIRTFAVDSGGNSYVTSGAGAVRKYDPSGALLYVLDPGIGPDGLAIDASDNLFAQGFEDRLSGRDRPDDHRVRPRRRPLKRFGYGANLG